MDNRTIDKFLDNILQLENEHDFLFKEKGAGVVSAFTTDGIKNLYKKKDEFSEKITTGLKDMLNSMFRMIHMLSIRGVPLGIILCSIPFLLTLILSIFYFKKKTKPLLTALKFFLAIHLIIVFFAALFIISDLKMGIFITLFVFCVLYSSVIILLMKKLETGSAKKFTFISFLTLLCSTYIMFVVSLLLSKLTTINNEWTLKIVFICLMLLTMVSLQLYAKENTITLSVMFSYFILFTIYLILIVPIFFKKIADGALHTSTKKGILSGLTNTLDSNLSNMQKQIGNVFKNGNVNIGELGNAANKMLQNRNLDMSNLGNVANSILQNGKLDLNNLVNTVAPAAPPTIHGGGCSNSKIQLGGCGFYDITDPFL